MNIFQKIREVKLPFLAVVAALAFGGIVAPASAAGTSVTSSQVSTTLVQRGTSSYSSNGNTVVATVGANETVQGGYFYLQAADPNNPLTIQAGDSFKAVATYTNLTSSTTATVIKSNWMNASGSANGNAPYLNASNNSMVTGSNNTVTQTMTLGSLTPGTYNLLSINFGIDLTDAAVAANDQLQVVAQFMLVRGGTETILAQRGNNYGSNSVIQLKKVSTLNHTMVSGDNFTYTNGYFCVFNNQNGVTNGTQIEITVSNSGDSGIQNAMVMPQNAGQLNGVNNVFSFTLPSSNWTRHSFSVMLQPQSTSVNKTWQPSFTAVIAGTNTNVMDSCNSQQVTPPAPAQVTATVRPLPQINFAANPVNGVSARPTADTRKGTLTIEGSNLSDLTSITIGGKAATFTVKDGKLDIKLPAGVTGFPEVVMTNASGSITMQNAIEIYAPTVQKLTKFVGERLTLAGMEVLENLYINNKTATALEATVVVAPDATEAEIAKAVAAATKAVTYIDKVGKRIVRTAVTVSKTGEAGTKPAIEMSFTK